MNRQRTMKIFYHLSINNFPNVFEALVSQVISSLAHGREAVSAVLGRTIIDRKNIN